MDTAHAELEPAQFPLVDAAHAGIDAQQVEERSLRAGQTRHLVGAVDVLIFHHLRVGHALANGLRGTGAIGLRQHLADAGQRHEPQRPCDAAIHACRPNQHHRLHHLGPARGELDRHGAAQRRPDDGGLPHPGLPHDVAHGGGEEPQRVGRVLAGNLRASAAGQVDGQHAVGGREALELFAPDFHRAADAVDQHQVPVAIALQPIAQPQGIAVGIPIGW